MNDSLFQEKPLLGTIVRSRSSSPDQTRETARAETLAKEERIAGEEKEGKEEGRKEGGTMWVCMRLI